jgi:hypothetical protein
VTALGLLLATMEPPPAIEEEFQAWYDTEHFPERRDCAGFLTAGRYVCLDGWPKYLALYDLQDTNVLQGEAYAAIAVRRYSPWTHRIMAKVWGQYRADARQVFPGNAKMGDNGPAARVVLWRFRAAPEAAQETIVARLREIYAGKPETAQVRLFLARQPDGTSDFLALAELRTPRIGETTEVEAFGDVARYIDLVNVYVAYTRRAEGAFPART